MSVQITAAMVEQYSANVEHLGQQMESRFAGKVREESQKGKTRFFEQLGATKAVKRTSRHADTPRVDSLHRRRAVYLQDYDWSDLVDSLDEVKLLIDPKSSYAQSAAMAMNRAKDEEVIAAATGTAYADVDGSDAVVAVALPASSKIAVDYVLTGSAANSGLTLAKLIKAKSNLTKSEVPKGTRLFIAVTQQQIDDLLNNVSQVSSSDYASVKALVNGDVNYFAGLEFIRLGSDSDNSAALTLNTSTDVRTCFAFAQTGLLASTGQAATGDISKRADKNNAVQVYYNQSCGATRMQESFVQEILCDESP
tara:strand:+ start:7916 stop:8842 length:927 start_codon:yes stop_codon:yes gene_type:complete